MCNKIHWFVYASLSVLKQWMRLIIPADSYSSEISETFEQFICKFCLSIMKWQRWDFHAIAVHVRLVFRFFISFFTRFQGIGYWPNRRLTKRNCITNIDSSQVQFSLFVIHAKLRYYDDYDGVLPWLDQLMSWYVWCYKQFQF